MLGHLDHLVNLENLVPLDLMVARDQVDLVDLLGNLDQVENLGNLDLMEIEVHLDPEENQVCGSL